MRSGTLIVVLALLCSARLSHSTASSPLSFSTTPSSSRRRNVQPSLNSTYDYYNLVVYPATPSQHPWRTPNSQWTSYRAQRRTYVSLDLSFAFPFYGVGFRSVAIASGGFISVVPAGESPTVETYYVAPLMSDFEPANADSSADTVFYYDSGFNLTVQWINVVIAGNASLGSFSFQAVIDRSGTIVFNYLQVPVTPNLLQPVADGDLGIYPVQVGVADAYLRNYTVNGQPVIIDYQYDSITVPEASVTNGVVAVLQPLPTCLSFTTCSSCLLQTAYLPFSCVWCPGLGMCSDGFDYYRNTFLNDGCDLQTNIPAVVSQCPSPPPISTDTFTFLWAGSSFAQDCWYWLSIRLNLNQSQILNPAITTLSSDLQISFQYELTPLEFEAVTQGLESPALLRCSSGSYNLQGVGAESASTSSQPLLSSNDITIVVACGVVALILIVIIAALLYAYTHPLSPSGQWLARRRAAKTWLPSKRRRVTAPAPSEMSLDDLNLTDLATDDESQPPPPYAPRQAFVEEEGEGKGGGEGARQSAPVQAFVSPEAAEEENDQMEIEVDHLDSFAEPSSPVTRHHAYPASYSDVLGVEV